MSEGRTIGDQTSERSGNETESSRLAEQAIVEMAKNQQNTNNPRVENSQTNLPDLGIVMNGDDHQTGNADISDPVLQVEKIDGAKVFQEHHQRVADQATSLDEQTVDDRRSGKNLLQQISRETAPRELLQWLKQAMALGERISDQSTSGEDSKDSTTLADNPRDSAALGEKPKDSSTEEFQKAAENFVGKADRIMPGKEDKKAAVELADALGKLPTSELQKSVDQLNERLINISKYSFKLLDDGDGQKSLVMNIEGVRGIGAIAPIRSEALIADKPVLGENPKDSTVNQKDSAASGDNPRDSAALGEKPKDSSTEEFQKAAENFVGKADRIRPSKEDKKAAAELADALGKLPTSELQESVDQLNERLTNSGSKYSFKLLDDGDGQKSLVMNIEGVRGIGAIAPIKGESSIADKPALGEKPKDSTTLGEKPKDSTTLGEKPKDSTTLGEKPKDSTTLGEKPKDSTTLGEKPKDSTTLGEKPKDSTALGEKPKDSTADHSTLKLDGTKRRDVEAKPLEKTLSPENLKKFEEIKKALSADKPDRLVEAMHSLKGNPDSEKILKAVVESAKKDGLSASYTLDKSTDPPVANLRLGSGNGRFSIDVSSKPDSKPIAQEHQIIWKKIGDKYDPNWTVKSVDVDVATAWKAARGEKISLGDTPKNPSPKPGDEATSIGDKPKVSSRLGEKPKDAATAADKVERGSPDGEIPASTWSRWTEQQRKDWVKANEPAREKGGDKTNDKTSEGDKKNEIDNQTAKEKPKPTIIEVALGYTDLHEALGNGVSIERHSEGDTLTFPDGTIVVVGKGKDGKITLTEIDPDALTKVNPVGAPVGRTYTLDPKLDPKRSFVKLANGTMIKVGPSGHIKAVRNTAGKVSEFEEPKF